MFRLSYRRLRSSVPDWVSSREDSSLFPLSACKLPSADNTSERSFLPPSSRKNTSAESSPSLVRLNKWVEDVALLIQVPSRVTCEFPFVNPSVRPWVKVGRTWNQIFPVSFFNSALAVTELPYCLPLFSFLERRLPSAWKVVREAWVPESVSVYLPLTPTVVSTSLMREVLAFTAAWADVDRPCALEIQLLSPSETMNTIPESSTFCPLAITVTWSFSL